MEEFAKLLKSKLSESQIRELLKYLQVARKPRV